MNNQTNNTNNNKAIKTAIQPTRQEDYAKWYQEVIVASDLADNSDVRGCMVIKPWGYAIWEAIQQDLDRRFKATGHVNAYFPLLIPLSYLEKEAEHVEGFAKECAVVTHHKLTTKDGKLVPDGELSEPLIIRPTSETIIGAMYSKWVKSYRDLPILINQWANVMRWEMRTRMFLRTSEFLWQEGHTAHSTPDEAMAETLTMLDVYEDFAENVLAIPVIKGEKPCFERFPGAVNTFTIEAMMQDCKALQAGTSHFLGQNFAKASEIKFLDKDGEQKYAWTTSWGVSTRLIGGVIMTHSDDNGLICPPKIAPQQIVIIPIYHNDTDKEHVIQYCDKIHAEVSEFIYNKNPVRVHIDNRDIRSGEKSWQWIKKGVPIRVEIGMRDINQDILCVSLRHEDVKIKHNIKKDEFIANAVSVLDGIQRQIFEKAKAFRDNNIVDIDDITKFNEFFNDELNQDRGFVNAYAVNDVIIEEFIKPLKVTARCIPLNQTNADGVCIFTGKKVTQKMIFARSY